MLHRGLHVLGFLFVGGLLAAACSTGKSGPGSGNGPGGHSGGNAGAGNTLNLGGSAGTNGIGGLGTSANGGMGPDGGVPEEVVYLCPGGTAEECCTQDAMCADATEYICTIDGQCGKVGG